MIRECNICFRLTIDREDYSHCPYCSHQPDWREIQESEIFRIPRLDIGMENYQKLLYAMERAVECSSDSRNSFTYARAFIFFLRSNDVIDGLPFVSIGRAGFRLSVFNKMVEELTVLLRSNCIPLNVETIFSNLSQ